MMERQQEHYRTAHLSFQAPPKPTWRCWIWDGLCYYVSKPPNAFHRLMQRIAFGFRWERLDPDNPSKYR